MILAVKVYFSVDAKLSPEAVEETVRALQDKVTENILISHPFREGYLLSQNGIKFLAKVERWSEIKKLFKVTIPAEKEPKLSIAEETVKQTSKRKKT